MDWHLFWKFMFSNFRSTYMFKFCVFTLPPLAFEDRCAGFPPAAWTGTRTIDSMISGHSLMDSCLKTWRVMIHSVCPSRSLCSFCIWTLQPEQACMELMTGNAQDRHGNGRRHWHNQTRHRWCWRFQKKNPPKDSSSRVANINISLTSIRLYNIPQKRMSKMFVLMSHSWTSSMTTCKTPCKSDDNLLLVLLLLLVVVPVISTTVVTTVTTNQLTSAAKCPWWWIWWCRPRATVFGPKQDRVPRQIVVLPKAFLGNPFADAHGGDPLWLLDGDVGCGTLDGPQNVLKNVLRALGGFFGAGVPRNDHHLVGFQCLQ